MAVELTNPTDLADVQAALGIIPTEDLPAATSIAGTEKIAALQGVTPVFVTPTQIAALGGGSFVIPDGTKALYQTHLHNGSDGNATGTQIPPIWSTLLNGTGATCDGFADHRGVRRLNTGTTTTGRSAIIQAQENTQIGTATVTCAFTMRFVPTGGAATDGTDTYEVHAGLSQAFPGTALLSQSDSAAFLYYWTGSAVAFVAVTRNNSGTAQTTTLTTPTANAWVDLKIVATATDVKFYVAGALVATHTTVPRTTIRLRHGASILKSAGTTTRFVDVDQLALLVEGIF